MSAHILLMNFPALGTPALIFHSEYPSTKILLWRLMSAPTTVPMVSRLRWQLKTWSTAHTVMSLISYTRHLSELRRNGESRNGLASWKTYHHRCAQTKLKYSPLRQEQVNFDRVTSALFLSMPALSTTNLQQPAKDCFYLRFYLGRLRELRPWRTEHSTKCRTHLSSRSTPQFLQYCRMHSCVAAILL